MRIVVLSALALAVAGPAIGSGGKLPPGTTHGPAHRLHQYASPALATPRERQAAKRLLGELRAGASGPWRLRRDALAAGFGKYGRPRRRAGDRSVLYFHAERRAYTVDGRYLDGRRPETLIYADVPGERLRLIGVMFSMPRGVRGPTPGGPLTRWHTHTVCARGARRGFKPRPDGSCPRGFKVRQGSEMLHVWFTRDLRSAFAIHAPEPELCRDGLLLAPRCAHTRHHGM